MIRTKASLFLLLLLFGFVINGQPQDKLTLTLEKSINLALKNNPEIKKAEKEVAKSRATVWEAYSSILPTLDLSASLQHAWEIQTNSGAVYTGIQGYARLCSAIIRAGKHIPLWGNINAALVPGRRRCS